MTGSRPNWFEVSSSADRDWRAAVQRYWTARAKLGEPWQPDIGADRMSFEHAQAMIEADIRRERAEYRDRVLGWYRKLCLPMRVGRCVPDEVAELLAEEWDEATR